MATSLDAALTTERVTFSAGSGDGTLAIMGRVRRDCERRGAGYPLDLSASDAATLVEALAFLAYESNAGEDLAGWAAGVVSSIGETLNVELI